MLHRVKGTIQVECDGCGESADTETSDFAVARAELKSQGWTSVKIGETWQHYCCPGCGVPERKR